MGKAFAAVARFLVALFIIALVGYNTYEVARLRAEVAALRAKAGISAQRPKGAGTMEQVAEARSHAEKATALLKEKKLSEAAAEMKAASEATARASGNAQAESRSTIAEMQQSLNKLTEQTGKLWKQAEAMTQKGDSSAKERPATKEDTQNEKSDPEK